MFSFLSYKFSSSLNLLLQYISKTGVAMFHTSISFAVILFLWLELNIREESSIAKSQKLNKLVDRKPIFSAITENERFITYKEFVAYMTAI